MEDFLNGREGGIEYKTDKMSINKKKIQVKCLCK